MKKIEQGELKKYKRKRKGRQKQKTTRNSAWPLQKIEARDENELEIN